MPPVIGRVAGLSNFYADGTERQEIHVPLDRAAGLPYRLDDRVSVDLCLGTSAYTAGLRAKRSIQLVWICPDLRGFDGAKVRLVEALRRAGFQKGDRIRLDASGNRIDGRQP